MTICYLAAQCFYVGPCCSPRYLPGAPSQCPGLQRRPLPPGSLESAAHSPDEDASSPPTPIDGLLHRDSSHFPIYSTTTCWLPRYIRGVLNHGLDQCSREHLRCCRAGGQLHVQCADSAGKLATDGQYNAKRGPLPTCPDALTLTLPRRKCMKPRATTPRRISSYTDTQISFFRSYKRIPTGTSLIIGKHSMRQRRPSIAT
jgi:hypothetical protein